MRFWKRSTRKEETSRSSETGAVEPARTKGRRTSPVALEVKLLAIEAVEGGAETRDVARVIGVHSSTLSSWHKQYREVGVSGMCRKASSIAVRRQCTQLEEKILAHRRAHPEHGVRRIRDELRRDQGLAVSAEKVRTVVNEAGLGNPPPTPHRRPSVPRRFERTLPNAMWQIDIFTFQLKRLYRVYVIGIIDDHSRFLVGWGLYRRQTTDAVLEVLKGAIGQWGAPREILSDNGRQFVAWRGETRFQRVLKQQGIQHVRSAPHHPMTLGKIERFWQTLWREYLGEAVFASYADACRRLDHWIQYYNHQRPHQGIDGSCPADRFYGLEGDVTEAVRQGCDENALRLALGQETQPPLYLLGQLGGTDVRVVRKGEDIEVKVGEAVREVIRVGSPYEIGEDGRGRREASPGVEEPERCGTLPGGGARAEGGDGDRGPLPDVRGESPDALPGDGGGGPGFGGSADAEASWAQAEGGFAEETRGDGGGEGEDGEGAEADVAAVRGGAGAPGSSAEGGTSRADRGGEKGPSGEPPPESEERYFDWDDDADGRWP
jgi:transposase InsO family protein